MGEKGMAGSSGTFAGNATTADSATSFVQPKADASMGDPIVPGDESVAIDSMANDPDRVGMNFTAPKPIVGADDAGIILQSPADAGIILQSPADAGIPPGIKPGT